MNIIEGQGWPDFCMLPKVDEDEFFNNLKLRFDQRQIYTYIGEQVVSMNPFQRVEGLTSDQTVKEYQKKYMYEVQPHIFALAEDTYTCLMTNRSDQCVIVTGESGAGKTEASKIFMSYIAKISGKGEQAERIKARLLDSNPVLEAFGNAKTVRNDNSSRFGKYMEIQFDGAGAPQAGKISQYLLEKSRVVTRAADERSFHIFYFLLSQKAMLPELNLDADHSKFNYLKLSGCYSVPHMNDSAEFDEVSNAMTSLGFGEDNKKSVWSFLSAILNLGNIQFEPDTSVTNTDASKIVNKDVLAIVAKRLSVDPAVLEKALVSRSITTGAGGANSNIDVLLTVSQAEFSRDSLAKALYDKMFDWVVKTINSAITSTKRAEIITGVLDIYGFEIFDHNSFEQFCINYCNEKLQQLFIELVLKQEQEEYIKEGIEWTPIDYFNNAPIVNLIEGKTGIYRMLDDTCMVGKATPMDFLDRLDNSPLGKHEHYASFRASKDKSIGRESFRIKHYAGVVDYEVEGFLFKNSDTLWGSLKEAMQSSTNTLMSDLFPVEKVRSKARPVTAGTGFTKSVNELIVKLQECQPHYIRCIKSNDQKRGFTMNEERVRHQCRYLNLVETVRVRKAGFCARRPYSRFLPRYKMLSKDTWPIWRGSDRDGVQKIFDEMNIGADEYKMGNTKVFVKDAMTLFKIEQRRQQLLPIVAIKIQSLFRGWKDRKWVKEHRSLLALKKHAAKIQNMYIKFTMRKYFRGVLAGYEAAKHDNFGKNFVIPDPGHIFPKALKNLQLILHNDWARRKVMSLTPEQQGKMRQKVLALTLFSGKKPWNCSRDFVADYCNVVRNPNKAEYEAAVQTLFQSGGDSKILFSDTVAKVNRKGVAQVRALILTDKNIYKYEPKKFKMKKEAIPLTAVKSLHCSTKDDCYVVIKMEAPVRDMVLDLGANGSEMVSEFATILYSQLAELRNMQLPVTFEDKITFNNSRAPGKEGQAGTVQFQKNPNPKNPGRLPGKEMRRLSQLALSLDHAAVFKKTSAGNFAVLY